MQHDKEQLLDRFQGCLLGLAVGDAVGTTLEFKPPGSFEPINDMIGGGPFNLQPGQWTDDTSMALCLAHSLLHCQGFDAEDQMNRYCNWWQWGYMSSTGECFDIGITVSSALKNYLRTQNPYSGSVDPKSAGNGSLMRLAPIALFYFNHFEQMIRFSGASSRTTHAAEECVDACQYFSSLLYSAFKGESKDVILSGQRYTPTTEKVSVIATGTYKNKSAAHIKGTGYVIDALEASLWCFAKTDSFEEAILQAANFGDDADTTAAITGQIAGAYYGLNHFPSSWLNKLYEKEQLKRIALDLSLSMK